ncbi:glycosyltransferase family 2 protein [Gimesia fumaroli]|jgi:glycosyltransferase involved in cell wall biosynthesis|uniref:PGL/p-HBAD biosynthesis glycosyltransferase n=1 Tax=Gimesia fumaroli TaxID=2527976 RepID=A0A518I929_9PLAN|nr:glycosyltransferase family A protein [Gimesia fumaroli]QDV49615.1 PGL/p-HBAD biosynthesis glycosyltransferase [Gimesia fumaroli]
MVGNALWPKSDRINQQNQSHAQPKVREDKISIVITARNNALFLAESIESALNQSLPCEVIYSDDCSFDDSITIANRYHDEGVVTLETPYHIGVCEARNRGAAQATGNYLLFLDGDDILPPDYVKEHWDAMTPTTPFVYGGAEAFGDFTTLWDAPEWKQGQLWLRNFINTSALWNRQAFETAGRWQNKINTMWDWDLALRGARLGAPALSKAILKYRQHTSSWSANIQTKYEKRQEILLPQMRRACARLSVGSIISGRLASFFPEWMSAVAQSVNLINSQEPVELVLLDNSRNENTLSLMRAETNRYRNTFETIRIIPHPVSFSFSNEKERRDQVAKFMAHSCNRLSVEMRGDVHWLIEDDILLPLEAGANLMNQLTDGWVPPNAVSGCYRSRHTESQFVGGHFDDYHLVNAFTEIGTEATPVDYCGTGCLMFWRDRTPRYWDSHYQHAPAHDWEWCARVKQSEGEILMLPSVHCGHVKTPEDILY